MLRLNPQLNNTLGMMHCHLTLAPSDKDPVRKGWKLHEIFLEKGHREQIDKMLTRYFLADPEAHRGSRNIKKSAREIVDAINIEEIALIGLGFDIVRAKLELDANIEDEVEFSSYKEVHIPIHVKDNEDSLRAITANLPPGWVRSNNPNKKLEFGFKYYLNRRYYTGTGRDHKIDFEACIDVVRNNQYGSPKVEIVLADSNHNRDAWWA